MSTKDYENRVRDIGCVLCLHCGLGRARRCVERQLGAYSVTMKTCKCAICLFTRKVLRVQKKLSPKEWSVIEELLNRWEAESTEATYWKMKFKETWPK